MTDRTPVLARPGEKGSPSGKVSPDKGRTSPWPRPPPALLVHRVLMIDVAGQLKLKSGVLHVKVPAQAFLEPVQHHPAAAVGQDLRVDDDVRGEHGQAG